MWGYVFETVFIVVMTLLSTYWLWTLRREHRKSHQDHVDYMWRRFGVRVD